MAVVRGTVKIFVGRIIILVSFPLRL